MRVDTEKVTDLIRAAEARLAQAGPALQENGEAAAAFSLRMAGVYCDLAKAMLGTIEGEITRTRAKLTIAYAGHEPEMAQIAARSSDPVKEWETFEKAYWEAWNGRPIRESSRAYMRGYRLGQSAKKSSGR